MLVYIEGAEGGLRVGHADIGGVAVLQPLVAEGVLVV